MSAPGQAAGTVLDLRRTACPITFVKTRIALERAALGDQIEVWLAAGEAVESVPKSAVDEGHRVLSVEQLPDATGFRVLIEKGARAPGGLP